MRTVRMLSVLLVLVLAMAGCGRHYYYYYVPSGDDGGEEETVEPQDGEEEEDAPGEETGTDAVLPEEVLLITGPAEDAEFMPGDELIVEWASSPDVATVAIQLMRSGSVLLETTEATESDGEETWDIPADINDGNEAYNRYQIRMTVLDPKGYVGYALSEYFTIGVAEEDDSGLSDVVVASTSITITVIDSGALIDDDTVDILLNGEAVISGLILVGPPGMDIPLELDSGDNTVEIYAVNEGTTPPNTATLLISDVTEGEAEQEWHLSAGETGSLVVTAEPGS